MVKTEIDRGDFQDWHPCRCDNCGKVAAIESLAPVEDLDCRVEAGGEVPAGQCRHCGALAYLMRPTIDAIETIRAYVEWRDRHGGPLKASEAPSAIDAMMDQVIKDNPTTPILAVFVEGGLVTAVESSDPARCHYKILVFDFDTCGDYGAVTMPNGDQAIVTPWNIGKSDHDLHAIAAMPEAQP